MILQKVTLQRISQIFSPVRGGTTNMRRAVMPLTAEAEEARKRCGMAVKKKKHSGWRKDACF